MNQPLGYKVGNWLEVEESMEGLQGNGPDDVMEITHMLAGTMIMLGGKADIVEEGIEMSHEAVQNGQAFDKWLELTEEQGGDTSVLKDFSNYDHAEHSFDFTARESGYISEIDAYNIGMASLELGAGRKRKEDDIDPAAGIELHHKIGSKVEKGQPLITGYMNDKSLVESSKNYLKEAFTIKNEEPEETEMITHRVDREGIHTIGG